MLTTSSRSQAVAVAVLALLLAGACAGGGSATGSSAARATREAGAGKPVVVASISPITSIVATVAGEAVRVVGVVPEGQNSHEFEPPPSLAKILGRADLVFLNGLHLEEPMRELAEANIGDGARIIALGDRTLPREEWIYDFSFPEADGDPNPHTWTSPVHARRYAEVVKDELAGRYPFDAAGFDQRYEVFVDRLERLDEAIRSATGTVPEANRRLLTYHDSFAYFAQEYGWDVIGAVQPSDFSEPSAREVAALIDQVRSTRVPAIFGSEVFPSRVLEQIAREADVTYVDALRDDDLPGAPGDEEHSYLGMMRFNLVTIVKALGGDAATLEELPVGDAAPLDVEYR